MKTFFTIFVAVLIALPALSQKRAIVTGSIRDKAAIVTKPDFEITKFKKEVNPTVKSYSFPPEEEIIGDTRYDDQANSSIQNRIYLYDDGTIGATWTRALDDGSWSDRGTGYNYFDGDSWGDFPTEQVEEERVGWPSYTPLGENGELVVAHGSDGLIMSSRDQKGTGDWNYSLFEGPAGHEYIIWNRTFTSGINNMRVHTMAVTASTVYQGTPYQGLDGALVYSLSTDGGVTWEIENAILEGMGSDYYVSYIGDTYTFAPPREDIIAFVVGESWYDLFLMKSTDGGETFEKTVIWEHPYPFFDPNALTVADTFYCADGSQSCVIDVNDVVHVAFGINRAYSDGAGAFWFPGVGGIAYWNENMPTFSNNMNALSPYGDPGTELVEDYNLIGWTQDINGNDTIDVLDEWGTYYIGFSSMPQLVYGQNNQLYLVYSSVTESYDNDVANYRHLWARTSTDGGLSWGNFFDLTGELIHIFDECVYPSCAANSDDYIHLVYQTDNEPGVAIWGTLHSPTDNNTVYMKVLKDDITGIHENKPIIHDYDVSQNYPNPFSTASRVKVNLREASDLQMTVVNMVGQIVYQSSTLHAKAGMNTLTINGAGLSPGIYFYTIKAGNSTISKKMIVE